MIDTVRSIKVEYVEQHISFCDIALRKDILVTIDSETVDTPSVGVAVNENDLHVLFDKVICQVGANESRAARNKHGPLIAVYSGHRSLLGSNHAASPAVHGLAMDFAWLGDSTHLPGCYAMAPVYISDSNG
jgi:hypothetical protein